MVESINRNRAHKDLRAQMDLDNRISRTQQSIATGQRYEKPSDNVQAWVEISNIDRYNSDEAAWMRNIGRAENNAAQSEGALDAISSGLIRARELLVSASNGTLAPQDREVIALEIDGLAQDFEHLLDQKDSLGGKLFSNTAPLAIPTGENRSVTPAPSRADVSANIDLGGGSSDSLANIMSSLASAIRSGDSAQMQSQFARLDGAQEHMTTMLTRQGVARKSLETHRIQLEESRISLADRRSKIAETDVTEAIVTMQQLLVNQEAARSIYGRVNQSTLFDYL